MRQSVKKRLLPAVMLLVCATVLNARSEVGAGRPWLNAKSPAEQRARQLLAAMTLDEKLILLFGYFGSVYPKDCAPPAQCYYPPKNAIDGAAGYIPGIPRLGIPAQFQTDASLGVATSIFGKSKRERTALPATIGTAATWNPALAYAGGAMIGDEARRSGFNVMLAGGVNLAREPRNGRNFEYAGEDPLLAGVIVGAQVAGIQSNYLISTIKHFALNDQETDRQSQNVIIDPAAARISDLLAFQIALEKSNAGAVMSAYNRINGEYASENKWLLTDVLRRDWGFEGYVMSDWGGVHSTVKAIEAGLDQESGFPFDGTPYFGEPLRSLVRSGTVSEAHISAMVKHILQSMFAHGLFEHPAGSANINYSAHAEISQKVEEQGIVLLKNADDILPLSKNIKRIGVIGGYADKGVLAGGGSSLVYPFGGNAVPDLQPTQWPGPVMYYPSSPLAEIRKLAPNAAVNFDSGFDREAALRLARDSDVAIVFATQWAAESLDVSLALDGQQDQLIGAVAAANPNTIVVLETGGPVLMPWRDRVAAIIEAWYPGTAGGAAIADILFGNTNPSGHLPVTFPRALEQLPRPAAPAAGDTRYTEGAAVGYKWFDLKNQNPLYAFGYGLSYTTFQYSDLAADTSAGEVTVHWKIRNTGRREGMAVSQIYIGGDKWESPKRLGGWQKVILMPDEYKSVSIKIDPRLLSIFNAVTNQWEIAEGTYRVMLGSSAKDIQQIATLRLPEMNLPAGWRPK
jgi:beta-glucosidase